MPYILLLFGSALFVSGVRNTEKQLWSLLKGDFSGNKSFLLWVGAIGIVGGAGYIKPLRGLSVAFMTLMLLVLLLKNNGVIAQLKAAVEGGIPANDNGAGATKTGFEPLAPLPPLAVNI